ncbi:MAG TPA: extracellular solute-binding protein [Actinomycetota bacterium]|nr:extracellular solute-binding protein [Actinomycetota bacterium]
MTGPNRLSSRAILLALALLLAACGSARSGDAPLVLYSGQHPQTVSALVAAFTNATGIKVSVRSDDEGTLANQILQESKRSPADLFYTENSPPLEALAEHGLLAPVDASTLAAVPSRYSSDTGDWVGVSARAASFVYNTSKLAGAGAPSSVLDLAQPGWKGKLGLAPTESDFQPLVTAVARLDGTAAATAWLTGLKANAQIYPDNESLVAAINNGQVAAGVINSYYWYRLRDEVGAAGMHSALAPFAPGDPGNLVDVSGAAVLASSRERAAAQKFLAFLVGPQGQQIIATSESYEYPIGSGITTAKVTVPLSALRPPSVSVADLGDGSAALSLLQHVGLVD